MPTVSEIVETLRTMGEAQYGREAVSQLQHALQCADLAEQNGATSALIAASLLHDMGHLVDKKFDVGQNKNIDRQHETIGAAYLSSLFSSDVTEPIRLHVAAKRYLCAIDAGYFDDLSPASVRSLELQGGIFSDADAKAFIYQPFAEDAVRVRRWDDLAKVPDRETPPLEHFIPHIERVCVGRAA